MLTTRPSRAAAASLATALLAGCNHFVLDVDTQNAKSVVSDATPAIGSTPEFSQANVTSLDLYASVYLTAAPPPDGSAINVCRQPLFDKFAFTQQTAISMAIRTGEDTATGVPMPIFTVSADPASCSIAYEHRFVFPPQTLASVSHNNISAVYSAKVTAQEKLSKYLADAAALAGQFVAGGSPIVTTLTNVANLPIANDVKSDFNAAFSQNNTLASSLVDLDSADTHPPVRVETTYPMVARPLDSSGKLAKGAPQQLGSVKVVIERDLTLLGQNRPGQLPAYSAVSETTKIGTIVEDASGAKRVDYNFLDFIANAPPATAVDNTKNLAANATDDVVKRACSQLRVTLNKIGLNRLDTTAFLWRVYTWSDYAQQKQDASQYGPCLESQAELDLLKALNLMGWLRTPHSVAREHGVPNYFVPGMPR